MSDLYLKFQSYLSDNLGISFQARPWRTEKKLPPIVEKVCSFSTFEIFNRTYLVMQIDGEKEVSPVHVRKYLDMLAGFWDDEIIYLTSGITSYNRKRLIERKVSFVVPGSQMFLPLLGIDLREHFRRQGNPKKKFSPSTQVVILSMIYGRVGGRITPTMLAHKLKYTTMTMGRALDEVKDAGLCNEHKEWRERVIRFSGNRKRLWERGRSQMVSPVRKRCTILISDLPDNLSLILAGESALARYNMLEKPGNPVYAISGEAWKSLSQNDNLIVLESDDPDAIHFEVWKYPPEQFSKNQLIDPLSLYLSMREEKDSKISAGLKKLMDVVGEGFRSDTNS
jgi:hypothetical protein